MLKLYVSLQSLVRSKKEITVVGDTAWLDLKAQYQITERRQRMFLCALKDSKEMLELNMDFERRELYFLVITFVDY